MRNIYLLFFLFASTFSFSQIDFLTPPQGISTGETPDFTRPLTREAVDTCGAYFNNYIGLVKTSDIFFEEMRSGDGSDFTPYAGRGQRFHANQPIEVSGLQFYAFQNNPDVDSLMAITVLFDYDEDADSVGIELARDTVYVSHTAFTPLLTDLEVDSYFDEPVTVTEDYIVAVYTATNDSLKIITNSAAAGDGDGEGVSFAYYDNPFAPSFTGWYPTLPTFGPSYDIDYLINPLVRFELHDGFTMSSDSICPNIVSAVCVDYPQFANFSDPHYNRLWDDSTGKITWTWGDGLQNEDLTAPCHTYAESGSYTITLIDSIRRHDYFDFTCAVEVMQTIVVLDSIEIAASHVATGLTVTFEGTATEADSVFWDFGDGSSSTEEDPIHMYDELDTYEVWFYAYGPCNTDSVMISVTTDDAGISEPESQFLIYPNPANEFVQIQGVTAGTQIELINIVGAVVLNKTATENTTKIETNYLAPGTYFIRLTTTNSQKTKKLVIKH